MKKFILEVLHEEIIPEENMLSITGGLTPECACDDKCYININCPQLTCNVNTVPEICVSKLRPCPANLIVCTDNEVACPYDTNKV
ncbi:MAG: hypothetical protein HDR98_05355 [Bacteroides sp.]|nr:hypothetical protein [Bacteroides sp.]